MVISPKILSKSIVSYCFFNNSINLSPFDQLSSTIVDLFGVFGFIGSCGFGVFSFGFSFKGIWWYNVFLTLECSILFVPVLSLFTGFIVFGVLFLFDCIDEIGFITGFIWCVLTFALMFL